MNVTRFTKGLLVVACVGSLAWIAFVLSLDLRYDMFPRVSIGGLKILLAAWLLAGLIALFKAAVTVLAREVRSMLTIGRNR